MSERNWYVSMQESARGHMGAAGRVPVVSHVLLSLWSYQGAPPTGRTSCHSHRFFDVLLQRSPGLFFGSLWEIEASLSVRQLTKSAAHKKKFCWFQLSADVGKAWFRLTVQGLGIDWREPDCPRSSTQDILLIKLPGRPHGETPGVIKEQNNCIHLKRLDEIATIFLMSSLENCTPCFPPKLHRVCGVIIFAYPSRKARLFL